MATFSVNNSNGRFTLTLTVTETSTSTADNTSTLSWSLDLKANTAYNFEKYAIGLSVSLNGTVVKSQSRADYIQYTVADYGTVNLAKGSGFVVKHNDDGSKSIPVAFSIDMAAATYTPGALSGSGNMALTTIARYSTLTVADGTLGTAQTLTVTRPSSAAHTVTWSCGTASGTICTNSTATSLAFTPPVDLAAQNTTGLSVIVTFTITTAGVGSKTAQATYAIPSSVKPSVTLAVSDATGAFSKVGAFVQGQSRLAITANATQAHGSPIAAYAISADGKKYTAASVTTDAIQASSDIAITATVTDKRSRTSDPASTTIQVCAYTAPVVSVEAHRCNSAGAADPEGAYMKISFTAETASLNGKNSATYEVRYKAEGTETWTTVKGSGVTHTTGAIACATASIWNIEVAVTDMFSTVTRAATIPIAFTLLDFYHTGRGITLGAIATQDGFVCAMDAVFRGAVTFEKTPTGMAAGGSAYTLPTASTTTLGGVKIDGSTVTINNGVISAKQYSLPTASTSALGGVKVDGSSITINNGVIAAAKQSTITSIASHAAGTTATSCSFTPASYDILLMGLTPSASGAICTVAIPAARASSGTDFQVADETNYCKWTLSSTGLTRASGAGNIRYIYGVKL